MFTKKNMDNQITYTLLASGDIATPSFAQSYCTSLGVWTNELSAAVAPGYYDLLPIANSARSALPLSGFITTKTFCQQKG